MAGLVAAGRFLWLPNWRPDLRPGERYAIDVSAHQGVIDWSAVRRDGIELAYLKATEGRDFVDEQYAGNVTGAARAGVTTGAYHFFTLCSPGAQQAAHFRRTVADLGELPPAVDLEIAGNFASRPSPEELERELGVFLTEVERWSGRPTVLYVGEDWEARYGLPADAPRPLWVWHLILRPSRDVGRENLSGGGGWTIWQASGYARVAGVDGDVDLDVVKPGGPAQVPQKVR